MPSWRQAASPSSLCSTRRRSSGDRLSTASSNCPTSASFDKGNMNRILDESFLRYHELLNIFRDRVKAKYASRVVLTRSVKATRLGLRRSYQRKVYCK